MTANSTSSLSPRVQELLDEVRDQWLYTHRDPSPNAPETPFWLNEALVALFDRLDAESVL